MPDSIDEKRVHRRQRTLKAGTVTFRGSTIDCVVRNISTMGAALEVESQIGIPSSFDLIVGTSLFRNCRLVWRGKKRIGVVFEKTGI